MTAPAPTPPEGPTPSAARDPARVGHRVFTALHLALVLYVIISGVVSVVPQIFWPGRAEGEGPAPEGAPEAVPAEGCAAVLDALETELVDRTTEAARGLEGRPGTDLDARAWLDTWDGRYRALEAPCGHLRSYPLLARVRYAVEEDVLRTITETSRSAAETRRALDEDLQQR